MVTKFNMVDNISCKTQGHFFPHFFLLKKLSFDHLLSVMTLSPWSGHLSVLSGYITALETRTVHLSAIDSFNLFHWAKPKKFLLLSTNQCESLTANYALAKNKKNIYSLILPMLSNTLFWCVRACVCVWFIAVMQRLHNMVACFMIKAYNLWMIKS